jgi:hypothetical protein
MALHSDENPSAAVLVAPPQPQDCRKELLLVIAHAAETSLSAPASRRDDFAVAKSLFSARARAFASFEEAMAPKAPLQLLHGSARTLSKRVELA